MRLKHLHIISEYKNLKDFKLDFEGDSFIDVFVGKNGTGKSNLLEAIIEIFRHLYEFGSYEISKNNAIDSLSQGLIKYSEDENILRIDNVIRHCIMKSNKLL